MKVAICFYGQPRKYKKVLEQWQLIINELDADVFIHTWYGLDRGKQLIDSNELITDFSPKEIQTSNQHKFINLIPEDCKYENQSYHAMQQAFTITESFKLMKNYSNIFNKKYDVVIKCRMDIELINIFEFIEFIKTEIKENNLYVAGNHWQHHIEFDDNIMVGSYEIMKEIYSNFFDYTIETISKTKIIPGGEQNIFRYIRDTNLLQKIKKINQLNFNLLVYQKNEEIILNHNEI